jgi:hypothetical protein
LQCTKCSPPDLTRSEPLTQRGLRTQRNFLSDVLQKCLLAGVQKLMCKLF